jgi:hypothetical protein
VLSTQNRRLLFLWAHRKRITNLLEAAFIDSKQGCPAIPDRSWWNPVIPGSHKRSRAHMGKHTGSLTASLSVCPSSNACLRPIHILVQRTAESGNQSPNSLERYQSSQVNSRLDIQKLARLLRNPKAHYSVHKSPPLGSILSQINPVHTLSSHTFKIRFYPNFLIKK